MDRRPLEITLQCAKDLNKVNLITKMDVYAVVTISGGDENSKQKTKTPVDHDGDANPTWNFPMTFTVDEASLQMNRLTLDFKLVCERALGDKDVGEVHVPIKELLDSPVRAGTDGKQFVSYQVRKPNGKPKGQLSFSYKFGEKIAGTATAPPYTAATPVASPAGKDDTVLVTAYTSGPSSAYPPPAYPAVEGSGHYPPPATYPKPEESGNYPPLPMGYPPATAAPPHGGYPPPPSVGYNYPAPPAVEGSGPYPPPATYPKPEESGNYPPPPIGYPPASAVPPPGGYGYPAPPAVEGRGHYPPPATYPKPEESGNYPPPPMGYPQDSAATPHGRYPPPPPGGYGYPAPPHPGYGYPPPAPPGYGYPPQPGYGYPPPPVVQAPRKNSFGMGLGAGLLGGAVGGLLVGDIISDGADFDSGGFDF